MTDTIRCRCGYTTKGHCSQCESAGARLSLAVPVILLALLIGCPGGGEEPSVEASEGSCCACLFDAFPVPGEPCIYTSEDVCAERLKSNDPQRIDTWTVCLADLCLDVCEGLGPFDVIDG